MFDLRPLFIAGRVAHLKRGNMGCQNYEGSEPIKRGTIPEIVKTADVVLRDRRSKMEEVVHAVGTYTEHVHHVLNVVYNFFKVALLQIWNFASLLCARVEIAILAEEASRERR